MHCRELLKPSGKCHFQLRMCMHWWHSTWSGGKMKQAFRDVLQVHAGLSHKVLTHDLTPMDFLMFKVTLILQLKF